MATCVLAVAAVVVVSIAAPPLIAALAPSLAAAAPAITGALVGATSYTATKIAVNTVKERPMLEGFSPLACATNAAAGACFSQVSNIIGNAIINKAVNAGSGNVSLNASEGTEVHGNSLQTTKPAYGYALRDRTTDEILKYGNTLYPDTRYTTNYLDSIQAKLDVMARGSKAEMHFWQHDQIVDYLNSCGQLPPYNKSGW